MDTFAFLTFALGGGAAVGLGILGVVVGTIVTCSELLTSEKIYQQIMGANKV